MINLETNFGFDLILLDCRLRLLKYFFTFFQVYISSKVAKIFNLRYQIKLCMYVCVCICMSHFLKKVTAFFILSACSTWSMHRRNAFVSFLSPSPVKYYLNSKTFRHLKTHKEKLCNDDVCSLIDHRREPINMRQ